MKVSYIIGIICAVVAILIAAASTQFVRQQHAVEHSQSVSQQPTPVVTQAEPEQPAVEAPPPPKPLEEVIAQANDLLAQRKYDDANDAIDEVLGHLNPSSMQAAEFLIKKGEAQLGLQSADSAETSLRQALAVIERQNGALDSSTLPALRMLIVAYDEDNNPNVKTVVQLTERYQRILGTTIEEEKSTAADDAIVQGIVADVQNKVAHTDDSNQSFSSALADAIDPASEKYGERSYVVAQLWIKLSDAYASEQDSANSVNSERMVSVLSIMEQTLGPLDSRLAPVLNRLAAASDADGDHDTADLFIQRLSMLHAPASTQLEVGQPAPSQKQ